MSRLKATKRKRVAAQANVSNKISKISPSAPETRTDEPAIASTEPKHLKTLVSDEELETTVETLKALAEFPGVIKSKACRELRGAVYKFRHACTTGVNTAGNSCAALTITATDSSRS